jgi:hypothetical protein
LNNQDPHNRQSGFRSHNTSINDIQGITRRIPEVARDFAPTTLRQVSPLRRDAPAKSTAFLFGSDKKESGHPR